VKKAEAVIRSDDDRSATACNHLHTLEAF